MNTNDLSKFGQRELKDGARLLTLYTNDEQTQRARDHFGYSGVKLEFNPESGNVFLIDDDCNALMENDDGLLDLWLFTPNDGIEGFFDDLLEDYLEMCPDDKEYMQSYDTEHKIADLEIDAQDNDVSDDDAVNDAVVKGDEDE